MSARRKDNVELTVAWWRAQRPRGVGEADFETALRAAEDALERFDLDPSAENSAQALAALKRAGAEARETARALDDDAHAALRDDLARLTRLAEQESERVAAETADIDEAEEVPDHQLCDPVHLSRMIRKLAVRGPMIFGFAASPEPHECLLFIRPRGNARRLFDLARGVPGDGRPCCGRLFILPAEPRTLIVALETVPPTNLAKWMRRHLKSLRIRRVRKVLVLRDGAPVDASDDGEEGVEKADAGVASAVFAAGHTRAVPEAERRREAGLKAALMSWRLARAQASAEAAVAPARAGASEAEESLEAALKRWDNRLRRGVEAFLRTPAADEAGRARHAARARRLIDAYLDFVHGDDRLRWVDQVVVPDVSLRLPMADALSQLRRGLE